MTDTVILHPNAVTEISLTKGELLYKTNDPPDCAYIVESGEFLLIKDAGGDREIVERRGAGSIIGELSILTGCPRTVTVEAACAATVYRISARQILHRFEKLDPILRACVETSISFVEKLSANQYDPSDTQPVPSTLRNANELIERFKFERDILKGLDEDHFNLAFQPIVKLADGDVVGFEALMRWHHPKRGNVPPGLFIEIAEEMGSIRRLTDFAILKACAALKRFRKLCPDKPDFFASVNISGEDIDRSDFADFLAHALDRYGLSPKNIRLEVTETALVPDSKTATRTLAKLQSLGCGLSIDDFGTGYSNLAYLKELPLTTLKIDRAFAGDAAKNTVSRSIVKMMIGLGKELDVDVVAEGLETQEDVDALLKLGCDHAQGYFFSKPVTEDEFVCILRPLAPQRAIVA